MTDWGTHVSAAPLLYPGQKQPLLLHFCRTQLAPFNHLANAVCPL